MLPELHITVRPKVRGSFESPTRSTNRLRKSSSSFDAANQQVIEIVPRPIDQEHPKRRRKFVWKPVWVTVGLLCALSVLIQAARINWVANEGRSDSGKDLVTRMTETARWIHARGTGEKAVIVFTIFLVFETLALPITPIELFAGRQGTDHRIL